MRAVISKEYFVASGSGKSQVIDFNILISTNDGFLLNSTEIIKFYFLLKVVVSFLCRTIHKFFFSKLNVSVAMPVSLCNSIHVPSSIHMCDQLSYFRCQKYAFVSFADRCMKFDIFTLTKKSVSNQSFFRRIE